MSKWPPPLKRGYPGFSPAFTRRKNAANALSRRRKVARWLEKDQRPCRSGSQAQISLSWADWSPYLMLVFEVCR